MMQLELAVTTYEEAQLAAKYAFNRVEVCSALEIGGLTPSAGLIRQCVKYAEVEVHVLIRPRAGHFVYHVDEVAIMMRDIREAAKQGARGVVIGALSKDAKLDLESIERMFVQATNLGLEVTMHRAFDFCHSPLEALEQLASIGIHRLLTSGQKNTAIEGIELIQRLVMESNNRVQIMAGSGVNASNSHALRNVGVHALHFSARKSSGSTDLSMGTLYQPDHDKILEVFNALKE
jgi:copper homeostasis protein